MTVDKNEPVEIEPEANWNFTVYLTHGEPMRWDATTKETALNFSRRLADHDYKRKGPICRLNDKSNVNVDHVTYSAVRKV